MPESSPPRGGLQARLELLSQRFRQRFGQPPAWMGWGPGRVNIIGEHTDYNEGLAMPAAIDRWVVVALRQRSDRSVLVRSVDLDAELRWELGAPLPERAPSWQRFVLGCLAELAALHPLERGLEALMMGDVPVGAGLSSSAALELAWLNALAAASAAEIPALELARAGQRVEHRHLGLASGLLDQLASQLSRPGRLMVVDFATMEQRWVEARLRGWCWVVVDSGVRRELAASAYRERVTECARGLARARSFDPDLTGPRGLRRWHLAVLAELGEAVSARRLGHVLSENQRVRAMERALATGDASSAGAILSASHRSLAEDYQVSCPELDLIVELLEGWRGCAGARMVGGGFGGCALALVRTGAIAGLEEYLRQAYAGQPWTLRCWRFELVGGAGAVSWGP